MMIFNFYIALSSLVAAGFFASFKSGSNLESARWILAALLCLFALVFWKLDERNKTLIKNAERALKYFEQATPSVDIARVFSIEESETDVKRKKFRGLRKLLVWQRDLTYSECFNIVFGVFFLVGIAGIIHSLFRHLQWAHWYAALRRVL